MTILTESQYLPPIASFRNFREAENILVEACEHYVKASYRNRALISGPDGILRLSVPLQKGKDQRTIMKDVRISYDFDWQRIHWQSLSTCYRSSSYFEFYEDELKVFYSHKTEFLLDFNIDLLEWIFKKLKMEKTIFQTVTYQEHSSVDRDVRNLIDIKTPDEMAKLYHQVFDARHGFIPGLSIADLLFNLGPEAIKFL